MAYAALLSLTQTLEQKLHRNPLPQTEHHLETLYQQASFLREFLERSSRKRSKRRDSLECEIRDAAYKLEDLIESKVVDEFSSHEKESSFEAFENAIEEVGSIRAMEGIDEEQNYIFDLDVHDDVQDLQRQTILNFASNDERVIVCLDDKLNKLKNHLLGGSASHEVISIVGMGGIGKTTLARQVYNDEDVKRHFDICAWAIASQDFDLYRVLRDLLRSMGIIRADTTMDGHHLVEHLYKHLKHRRHLILIDDVWDIMHWVNIKRCFPDDGNGSRVIFTTRDENVAIDAWFLRIQMDLLNKDDSWTLFCESLGGKYCFSPVLEDIGKEVVQQCRGLPLALVAVGKFLSNVPKTPDVWTKVAKDVSAAITSDSERNSEILFLGYNVLPHHLKVCFLYLGLFPLDFDIPVSTILKLWIAEGFINLVESRSLEEVAEEYLLDLIRRNLILVSKRSSKGKVKTCKIHGLLRNICVKEAKKEMFFNVINKRLDGISEETCVCRLSLCSVTSDKRPSTLVPRSIFDFYGYLVHAAKFFDLSFLRILLMDYDYNLVFPKEITEVVNLRYLEARSEKGWSLASIYKLMNLQAIIVRPKLGTYPEVFRLPQEIWKMSQLRHVQLQGAIDLPNPPPEENSFTVLENLQSLCIVKNFRCTMEVIKRIPNLLRLGIYCECEAKDWEYFCLHNLALLSRLETVKCLFAVPQLSFLQNVTFPDSVTKITLSGCWLPWEDMSILGRLHNLAVLKLKHYAFSGPVWETNEGEFEQLKYLLIEESDLEHWRAESDHFFSLEHLIIRDCCCLEEIPACFREIPTLQSIEVRDCYDSLEISAKEIVMEQQDFGNEELRLQIINDETSNTDKVLDLFRDYFPSISISWCK